jgi:hypothetical protein
VVIVARTDANIALTATTRKQANLRMIKRTKLAFLLSLFIIF